MNNNQVHINKMLLSVTYSCATDAADAGIYPIYQPFPNLIMAPNNLKSENLPRLTLFRILPVMRYKIKKKLVI